MLNYKGIEWYNYHGALMPKTAPHQEITLLPSEEKELLQKSKALFLRYTNEWDRKDGNFWYIIKDQEEGLENYKSKIRNQIKRGLKECYVTKIDNIFLSQYGYDVYKEAFSSYNGDFHILSKDDFVKSMKNTDMTYQEYWGVFLKKDDTLIGYAQNIIQEHSCLYSVVKLDPRYLKFYGSYALFYEMNYYYLNTKKVLYVSDGARSLSHETNIQKFLVQKFLFRKAYCKLNIAYRLDLKILVFLLFPMRKVFFLSQNKFIKKISLLLKHEEIRRCN